MRDAVESFIYVFCCALCIGLTAEAFYFSPILGGVMVFLDVWFACWFVSAT
jgi:hypothetical protein